MTTSSVAGILRAGLPPLGAGFSNVLKSISLQKPQFPKELRCETPKFGIQKWRILVKCVEQRGDEPLATTTGLLCQRF
jgi:hypothetical protein